MLEQRPASVGRSKHTLVIPNDIGLDDYLLEVRGREFLTNRKIFPFDRYNRYLITYCIFVHTSPNRRNTSRHPGCRREHRANISIVGGGSDNTRGGRRPLLADDLPPVCPGKDGRACHAGVGASLFGGPLRWHLFCRVM